MYYHGISKTNYTDNKHRTPRQPAANWGAFTMRTGCCLTQPCDLQPGCSVPLTLAYYVPREGGMRTYSFRGLYQNAHNIFYIVTEFRPLLLPKQSIIPYLTPSLSPQFVSSRSGVFCQKHNHTNMHAALVWQVLGEDRSKN